MFVFWLVLIFIVIPIAELYVIIQVGEAIGILPTLFLLLPVGVLLAAARTGDGHGGKGTTSRAFPI